jgi:PfaD family protein
METSSRSAWAVPGQSPPRPGRQAVVRALQRLDVPFAAVQSDGGVAVVEPAAVGWGPAPPGALPMHAWVPAWTPDRLGDPEFCTRFGTTVAYCTGAMAQGIATARLVVEMARAGMLGFFGAAGLPARRIEEAIDTVRAEAGDLPSGWDLIHAPQEPGAEQETVDLYLRRDVTIAGASAFVALTPPLVQYRLTGLRRAADGRVVARNRIVAKVSRPEVAARFLRPAPAGIVASLVDAGRLTAAEAALAPHVPMADALVAEGDSGGHTDQRPLGVLVPLLLGQRAKIDAEAGLARGVLVGAAGGLGTPAAVAAAFSSGAAFVVTGSINQATVESGTSPMVRQMLAEANMADVGLAPASDMFEHGASVQVLARGTMYAARARQLRDLWRRYERWEDVPAADAARVESTLLRRPFGDVWEDCVAFFRERAPAELDRAEREPRHRMALVFRWYLGLSSRWAVTGDPDRRVDAQVWCGPAMGGFNTWAAGSFLADPAQRRAVDVAANLMAGAAAIQRAHVLRAQGVDPGPEAFDWRPRPIRRAGGFGG